MNFLLTHRRRLLIIGTGIVYAWFGMLKFFPGVSPAEALAQATLDKLTFGLVPTAVTYHALAAWEVLIGVALLLNRPRRWILQLTLVHLAFTFTPLFLLPHLCFQPTGTALTLVGQYIIKNLMLVGGVLFLLPGPDGKTVS